MCYIPTQEVHSGQVTPTLSGTVQHRRNRPYRRHQIGDNSILKVASPVLLSGMWFDKDHTSTAASGYDQRMS